MRSKATYLIDFRRTFFSNGQTNRSVGFSIKGQQLKPTLADIYLRTGNFQKNVLSYSSGTTQDNETNNTPFESPIK